MSRPKNEGGMGFRDLRFFNLAMLAKQGWRLLHDQSSLLFQCFKARYFPWCNFLDAVESPNCSYVWRSIVAALPILKNGSCWHVGNGESIKIYVDKWISNYPANRVLHQGQDVEREMMVSEHIDADLYGWRRDVIMEKFCREEADAICKIPLSRRYIADSVVWMHTKSGRYTIRSGYHVARKFLRNDDGIGSSRGVSQQVWKRIWHLHVPNKIKIFGWRACQDILPTRVNLGRRKIITERGCQGCTGVPDTAIHAIWECGIAQDVWAGCAISLQKCISGFHDVVALFEYLMVKLSTSEFEAFIVQAWLLWNQRNVIAHEG